MEIEIVRTISVEKRNVKDDRIFFRGKEYQFSRRSNQFKVFQLNLSKCSSVLLEHENDEKIEQFEFVCGNSSKCKQCAENMKCSGKKRVKNFILEQLSNTGSLERENKYFSFTDFSPYWFQFKGKNLSKPSKNFLFRDDRSSVDITDFFLMGKLRNFDYRKISFVHLSIKRKKRSNNISIKNPIALLEGLRLIRGRAEKKFSLFFPIGLFCDTDIKEINGDGPFRGLMTSMIEKIPCGLCSPGPLPEGFFARRIQRKDGSVVKVKMLKKVTKIKIPKKMKKSCWKCTGDSYIEEKGVYIVAECFLRKLKDLVSRIRVGGVENIFYRFHLSLDFERSGNSILFFIDIKCGGEKCNNRNLQVKSGMNAFPFFIYKIKRNHSNEHFYYNQKKNDPNLLIVENEEKDEREFEELEEVEGEGELSAVEEIEESEKPDVEVVKKNVLPILDFEKPLTNLEETFNELSVLDFSIEARKSPFLAFPNPILHIRAKYGKIIRHFSLLISDAHDPFENFLKEFRKESQNKRDKFDEEEEIILGDNVEIIEIEEKKEWLLSEFSNVVFIGVISLRGMKSSNYLEEIERDYFMKETSGRELLKVLFFLCKESLELWKSFLLKYSNQIISIFILHKESLFSESLEHYGEVDDVLKVDDVFEYFSKSNFLHRFKPSTNRISVIPSGIQICYLYDFNLGSLLPSTQRFIVVKNSRSKILKNKIFLGFGRSSPSYSPRVSKIFSDISSTLRFYKLRYSFLCLLVRFVFQQEEFERSEVISKSKEFLNKRLRILVMESSKQNNKSSSSKSRVNEKRIKKTEVIVKELFEWISEVGNSKPDQSKFLRIFGENLYSHMICKVFKSFERIMKRFHLNSHDVANLFEIFNPSTILQYISRNSRKKKKKKKREMKNIDYVAKSILKEGYSYLYEIPGNDPSVGEHRSVVLRDDGKRIEITFRLNSFDFSRDFFRVKKWITKKINPVPYTKVQKGREKNIYVEVKSDNLSEDKEHEEKVYLGHTQLEGVDVSAMFESHTPKSKKKSKHLPNIFNQQFYKFKGGNLGPTDDRLELVKVKRDDNEEAYRDNCTRSQKGGNLGSCDSKLDLVTSFIDDINDDNEEELVETKRKLNKVMGGIIAGILNGNLKRRLVNNVKIENKIIKKSSTHFVEEGKVEEI